jgi:phosphoserine phosphatase RsbU/P
VADDRGLLEALLAATHLVVPDELPGLVERHALRMGAAEAVVYLVDQDQEVLVPLRAEGARELAPVVIDATLAGRAYRSVRILDTLDDAGRTVVWVPMVDGAERLGVLQLVFPPDGRTGDDELRAFAGLLAELVMTKGAYGDFFEFARRQRPNTIAAELLWQLLPPLTFGTDDLVIAAAFVPTADLGGDAFDYGVDLRRAQVAIFDGMGHGLGAGLLATVAVAANRNARRARRSLSGSATAIGAAIEDQFPDGRFVTGVLTSLERTTGRLSWCVAGHPPPLLVRDGRAVKSLDRGVGSPFGLGPASEVFHEQLEPGDRVLLYTDGVTEARTADGELFDLERLVDLVERIGADDPPPETMRRLMHAIREHNHGSMRDDATVVLIEWHGSSGQRLDP